MSVSRRDFLRVAGVGVVATTFATNAKALEGICFEDLAGNANLCYEPVQEVVPMEVADSAYPEGITTIWVPSNRERNNYLNNTIFELNPAHGNIGRATLIEDVVQDKTVYGYFYTEGKVPGFVPKLDYTSFGDGEEPLPNQQFIGQAVPGTNRFLVDITPDGKVVAALTTIDPREFKSINWHTYRFESAKRATPDVTLSGKYNGYDMTLGSPTGSVVKVTGDTGIGEAAQYNFTALPGTVFVFTAKTSDNDNGWGTPDPIAQNRIDMSHQV